MSTAQNKALGYRYFEEVWSNKHIEAIDELLADHYIDHNPSPGAPPGRASATQWVTMLLAAFPDLHITVDDQVAEGDKVVTRWTAQGTHRGPLLDLSPTNKPARITGLSINRVADGQIQEGWGSWDQLGLLQQLGVLPAPGQPTR